MPTADDKRQGNGVTPGERQGEEPRRPLWSFATTTRKVRLGPNRTILGED